MRAFCVYHQMIEQSKLASLALSSSSLKKIQSISLCLKWRRREKERSGDREMFCIHWFILQVSTMAEDGQGQSQESRIQLLCRWEWPKYLNHYLLPPRRCTHKKLDQKQRWDLNSSPLLGKKVIPHGVLTGMSNIQCPSPLFSLCEATNTSHGPNFDVSWP